MLRFLGRGFVFSLLVLVSSACNRGKPLDPSPTTSEDDNNRPAVTLRVGDERELDIDIDLIPFDEDGDEISVQLFFSTDDGNVFTPCTPALSSENPTTGLETNEYVTFVWDSAANVGEATVIIRAVANDGTQDGEPVDSDPFEVANSVSSTFGPGLTEGDDLNDVGGMEEVSFDDDGVADLELNDGTDPSRDNREEEFLLFITNTGDSSLGYSISEDTESSEKLRTEQLRLSPAETSASAKSTLTPFRQRVRAWARKSRQEPRSAHAKAVAPAASTLEVGESRMSFQVRSELSDTSSYVTRTGILAAEGQYVLFYVDEDVPIDWDFDCDGVVDQQDAQERKTYGFDSCDLSGVASVFDNNILDNLQDLFGYVSDIDDNGYITVFITPILNLMTVESSGDGGGGGGNQGGDDDAGGDDDVSGDDDATGDDDVSGDDDATAEEEEEGEVGQVKIYVDPEVDLTEPDPAENPGSNYQEILYLYAPDPGGIFNPTTGGGGDDAIEQYVTLDMAANIAIATQSLISYNYHVIENGGDPEEDWLNDGLGLLAADLTGFGSVVYNDIFMFLDVPNLWPLTTANSIDADDDRGFQYLICRYLIDSYGTSILSSIIDSDETGVDNIEAALQAFDEEATFSDFILQFMLAITAGDMINNESGDALLDTDDVPGFKPATTIPPTSADFEGAQGNQQGINMFGKNTERITINGKVVTREYRFDGADWSHFAPGISYKGYLSGEYSSQVTWIGGLIDPETNLTIVGEGSDLVGIVVRLNNIDSSNPTHKVEKVFGTLADDLIKLNVFPDGLDSVGLGEIDSTQSLTLTDGRQIPVPDTDLYKIDLSDWGDSSVRLLVTLNRSITSSDGGVSLTDPILAIIPYGDLPVPSAPYSDPLEEETSTSYVIGNYICDGAAISVSYPSEYLEYLYYQFVLQPVASSTITFDPVGEESEDGTTCNFDLAINEQPNGFLLQNDNDEPQPSTLVEQVRTLQEQKLGGTSTVRGFYPYTTDFLDIESTDEDDMAYFEYSTGIGGKATASGEEALLDIELPAGGGDPGHQYVFVVGAEEGQGPYELLIRVLDD